MMKIGVLGSLQGLLVLVLVSLGCEAKVKPTPIGPGDDLGAASCSSMKCLNPAAVCCPGAECVDLTNDSFNCGACGKVCGTSEICQAGRCVCAPNGDPTKAVACVAEQTCCLEGCKALLADPRNCGACGRTCNANETCGNGDCVCSAASKVCPVNQLCCASGCVEAKTDAKNCGACGKTCNMGVACMDGKCADECTPACAAGQTCCGGKCVNLLNDPNNCRTCGFACPKILGVQVPCVAGFCLAPGDGGVDASMPRDM